MKKILFILALMMATISGTEAQRYMGGTRLAISIQTFYDELSPYGEWINSPEYGYVWRPFLYDNEDFRPYASGGHWVNSELGWIWASDYPWGWATFHYGRWYYDNYLGWLWIPGYEWAPAWVTWGSYNDCWGWAPLGPGISIGINIGWRAPDFWWNFVPYGRFCYTDWYRYRYHGPIYYNRIHHINEVYAGNWNNHGYGSYSRNERGWYYGPRVNDVERFGNTRVRQYQVGESARPGRISIENDRRLNIYRPEIVRNNRDARPANVRSYQDSRSSNISNPRYQSSNAPGMNRRAETPNSPRYANPTTQQGNRNNTQQGNRNNNYENRSRGREDYPNPVNRNGNDNRRIIDQQNNMNRGGSAGNIQAPIQRSLPQQQAPAYNNNRNDTRRNNYEQQPNMNRPNQNMQAPPSRSFPQQSPVYRGDRVDSRNRIESRPMTQRPQEQPSRIGNEQRQRSESPGYRSNNGGNNSQRQASSTKEERSSNRRR